jgi:hypothetical protein
MNAKLIAIYFPQFHAIAENNAWWGEGFTDWQTVRAATPLYDGHYQPRVPLHGRYYDQSQLDVLRWQVEIAKQYGIYGFCHYHYWFDGRQLLETPTNLWLENKDIDMPFCLSWANETWSRRWDGRNHEILIKQTHTPDKALWKQHFEYLLRQWDDPRAIKVKDKPVFVIYRPQYITQLHQMMDYWRELAAQAGLKGLYLMVQHHYTLPNDNVLDVFDGVFQFQPFEAKYALHTRKGLLRTLSSALPEQVRNQLHRLKAAAHNRPTLHDYDAVWQKALEIRSHKGLDTFPGAYMDWDNTPRYKSRATIFKGATPEKFEQYLRQQIATLPARGLPEPFIFINAWNEWAEGTYLEPDERYGYSYLEAVAKALGIRISEE